MKTIRLTAAQALVRYLIAQRTEVDGQDVPLFPGIWAIFGHGNVAGLGEALQEVQDQLPTLRAHNEQGMALAAVSYAKARNRRQIMACTTSIGPGATNMVTAAALAHVNRLPVLLIPGDIFAGRRPDPVLQQIEDFGDATVSANDCFRPVSRYFDRIMRPEQLLAALPRAVSVLTDPAECGPVTIAFPQDVQAEAFDYPEAFFAKKLHRIRRQGADALELADAVAALKAAKKPLIVAGGGVHYAGAVERLRAFAATRGIPVAETQAGKGALNWDEDMAMGSVGVTGASSSNILAGEADVVLAVGTRLQDFTTASRTLFANPQAKLIQLNITQFDAAKHSAMPLVGDADRTLAELDTALGSWKAPADWTGKAKSLAKDWRGAVERAQAPSNADRPSDAAVIGAVWRAAKPTDTVVCAAGGLPGELHKLWRSRDAKSYHLEYGYSCMGYEIAGGLGVKLAQPDREVFVMVGDGSYLMMNSELATSILLGQKLIITVLDNRGYGCINRLQNATGGASFNNLIDTINNGDAHQVDFAGHARALGAHAEMVDGIAGLEEALQRARAADRTSVVVIKTDAVATTQEGGAWWDVAVPEVSTRAEVRAAHERYVGALNNQRLA